MENTPRSTSISPIDLQSHLYASLLEARTADVALRVRGTWQAVYRLHRVVLIQAVSLIVAPMIFDDLTLPPRRGSFGLYLHLGLSSPNQRLDADF
jgi:hypothetical protein